MVLAGVADDQNAGLAELLCDLIRECAGRESASNGLGTSECAELQHRSLCVGARRDSNHVRGVVNRREDAGSKDELVPRLRDVNDVKAWNGRPTQTVVAKTHTGTTSLGE